MRRSIPLYAAQLCVILIMAWQVQRAILSSSSSILLQTVGVLLLSAAHLPKGGLFAVASLVGFAAAYSGLIASNKFLFYFSPIVLLAAGSYSTFVKPEKRANSLLYFSLLFSYPAFLAHGRASWRSLISDITSNLNLVSYVQNLDIDFTKYMPIIVLLVLAKITLESLGSKTYMSVEDAAVLGVVIGFGYLFLRYTSHAEAISREFEIRGASAENVEEIRDKTIEFAFAALFASFMLFAVAATASYYLRWSAYDAIIALPFNVLSFGLAAAVMFLAALFLIVRTSGRR